jgi:hypothetical protein
MTDNNIKKLLCYNTIKNIPCTYKSKCLFAHDLDEQQKDFYREMVCKIITEYEDLSEINIFDDSELLSNLMIYTHECSNCINNQCSGGYNCKYGACLIDLKICYQDLFYGKCCNELNKNNKCVDGHHLTEKGIIPYNQHLIARNINIKDLSFDPNIIMTTKMCSVIKLNKENITIVNKILNSDNKIQKN